MAACNGEGRSVEFTLNGRPVSVEVDPDDSLLDLLRGPFGLRSMKDGCAPEGSCGACTVIVDGRAVVSCAQPASRAAGHAIETLEGLAADIRASWADAFASTGASQCGYCSPGMVMKAEALLRRVPDPSPQQIAHALAGNLCRCTGYAKIIEAVRDAAARRRGSDRGDGSDDVADVAGRLALGDEEWPVVDDQALVALARHVGRGQDRDDARLQECPRCVDAPYGRPRVVGEPERAVEHPRDAHVRDERLLAEGELAGLVALLARPDPGL